MCKYCDEADAEGQAYLEQAKKFSDAVNAYINAKENKNMTATVTTQNVATTDANGRVKPSASRETVTIQKTIDTTADVFNVRLNKYQAGYLIDVLKGHLAGEVRTFLKPIADALVNAGAVREYATNNNNATYNMGNGYTYKKGYAVVDFADEYERELATGSKKKALY